MAEATGNTLTVLSTQIRRWLSGDAVGPKSLGICWTVIHRLMRHAYEYWTFRGAHEVSFRRTSLRLWKQWRVSEDTFWRQWQKQDVAISMWSVSYLFPRSLWFTCCFSTNSFVVATCTHKPDILSILKEKKLVIHSLHWVIVLPRQSSASPIQGSRVRPVRTHIHTLVMKLHCSHSRPGAHWHFTISWQILVHFEFEVGK